MARKATQLRIQTQVEAIRMVLFQRPAWPANKPVVITADQSRGTVAANRGGNLLAYIPPQAPHLKDSPYTIVTVMWPGWAPHYARHGSFLREVSAYDAHSLVEVLHALGVITDADVKAFEAECAAVESKKRKANDAEDLRDLLVQLDLKLNPNSQRILDRLVNRHDAEDAED